MSPKSALAFVLAALAGSGVVRSLSRDVRGLKTHNPASLEPLVLPPVSTPALAVGALATGALAVGALAIGALAIGRLEIRRARFHKLEVDDLTVRKFRIVEDASEEVGEER